MQQSLEGHQNKIGSPENHIDNFRATLVLLGREQDQKEKYNGAVNLIKKIQEYRKSNNSAEILNILSGAEETQRNAAIRLGETGSRLDRAA